MATDNTATDTDFDLDIRLIEYGTDNEQLVYNTDDGCGSTCGACTTGAS
jgi:FxLD family lantipeptide